MSTTNSRRIYERLRGGSEGFSLPELLVVVAIVGILAAIAIPIFLNQRGKARMVSLQSDFRNMIPGVEASRLPNSTFPSAMIVRDEVMSTATVTSPNTVLVWANCAQNAAGTAAERVNGYYILQGYVMREPGVFASASGTQVLTFDSRSGRWGKADPLYNQLNDATNPCLSGNAGEGRTHFYWNASNVLIPSTS